MSGINSIETQVNDPLLYLAPLPHVARYYPFGFPVDIAADMREVLDAAHESWGMYRPRFERPPIRFHVITSEGSGSLPPSPVLRGQRHLLMWVSDQENFAICDRLQRFGYACVTRATVADTVFFRWHFLEATISTLLEMNYFTAQHAACVALDGAGVLLYGESGVGKSTLSYACARRGWTYISDDASTVVDDDELTVVGEPHRFRLRAEALELFPELRGLTVGYPLDRKPTIEAYTANLPIRTAPDCRLSRIVFLNRQAGVRGCMAPVTKDEAMERLRQEMAVFDPEIEARRRRAVETICQKPAWELQYSHYEDAIVLLEQLVRRGEQA
ncbi:MAG TPA: hypothetical protein VKR61_05295 [Bryobacteraceae bacterium]|nr:hypothetical protein [Bryobacteraceae bacterium]